MLQYILPRLPKQQKILETKDKVYTLQKTLTSQEDRKKTQDISL